MRNDNPYNLIFGKEPSQLLTRYPDDISIIDDFNSINSQHVFMITGIRGSGKTVMLSTISNHFRKDDSWFVFDLSPDMDLLESFAAELGNERSVNNSLVVENIGISLPGLEIDVKNQPHITDAKVAVTRMLEIAKRKNKKVLITVDEAVNNDSVRRFSSVFQILLRQDLPVYLVMTGLYANIRALQDEKTLTFLYRAPKIEMKPINIGNISRNYKKTFGISDEDAREMALLTCGYPFAFQVLGYVTWENDGDYKASIDEYKSYLYDYVYEKIWMEMSQRDRFVAQGIAESKTGSIEEIKKLLEITQSEFNPYRKRLLDKGIVESKIRGKLTFTLPFFSEYIRNEAL